MSKQQVQGQVASVRWDPRAFGCLLWDTWAQADAYVDDEFAATDCAFGDGARPEVRLRPHRHRRDRAVSDPGCAAGEASLHPASVQDLDALVLQGGGDSAPHDALALVSVEPNRVLTCKLPPAAP